MVSSVIRCRTAKQEIVGSNPSRTSFLKIDKHLISPYDITNFQVTRIKEMIINIKRLDVYANSPNWYHEKYMDNSRENMHVDSGT